ncbi:MAG TPA: flagellar export chaperone FliS [Terracidiphilus sp.]|jgi:flagellar protein FliS|nr:flagellar export chaperone FliS [Terracidiphilus sp.]
MSTYRELSLEGASAVDLVVALYDGIIRFLYAASDACDRGDATGRRAAVKRALDIIIHLQARLRMDIGGRPAAVLSEFYASVFAQILQASQSASRAKFERAIECVRNVRDAWKQVAAGPGTQEQQKSFSPAVTELTQPLQEEWQLEVAGSSNWTA